MNPPEFSTPARKFCVVLVHPATLTGGSRWVRHIETGIDNHRRGIGLLGKAPRGKGNRHHAADAEAAVEVSVRGRSVHHPGRTFADRIPLVDIIPDHPIIRA